MEEKVSIVVATYNANAYIAQCIASLQNQTWKNLEIVIVDDGSSDETLVTCRALEKDDSRIRVLACEHRGVSETRNEGINHCSGRYITFVDSDDYADPNLVARYVEAAHSFKERGEDVSFILCGMQFEVHSGTLREEEKLVAGDEKLLVLPRHEIGRLCWLRLFNFVTNKMFDLEKINACGIRFTKDVQIGEDLKFNLDYLKAVPGGYGMVNEPLYHYVRWNEHSLSLVYYQNAISHTKQIYKELIAFAKSLKDITGEELLFLKGIYLADWTERITALYTDQAGAFSKKEKTRIAQEEICKEEYQRLLQEVYRGGKFSKIRYLALKTKRFAIYYNLRQVYRLIKGKKSHEK